MSVQRREVSAISNGRSIDRSDRAKQAERKCLFRSARISEQSRPIALVTRRSKGGHSAIFVGLSAWCFARCKIARATENGAVRESVLGGGSGLSAGQVRG